MLLAQELMDVYDKKFSKKLIYILLNIPKSTFYRLLKKESLDPSAAYLKKHEEAVDAISELRKQYCGETWGYRRMKLKLEEMGIYKGLRVVLRIMQELGIAACRYKREGRAYSSYVSKEVIDSPNLIKRDFSASMLGLKVYTDISEFKYKNALTDQQDKAYISVVVDGAAGIVTGFAISKTPNMDLVIKSVEQSFQNVSAPVSQVKVFHSDRGHHYNNKKLLLLLEQHGYKRSLSAKGKCADNGLMEGFFGTMKVELLYKLLPYPTTLEEIRQKLIKYINFYNKERPSTKTGFRVLAQKAQENLAQIKYFTIR